MFGLLLATVLIWLIAEWFTNRFPPSDRELRFLSVSVVFLSGIVLILLFAGVVLEDLTAYGVILCVFVGFIIAKWIFFRKDFRGLKACSWRWLPRPEKGHIIGWILMSLMILWTAWTALMAWLLPVYDWDGLLYHMTTVGFWLQAGRIEIVPCYNVFVNIFPKNGELMALWMSVFPNSDRLADISQLPFAWLGFAAVFSWAKAITRSHRKAFEAGAAFFFTPLILIHSRTTYVDLMTASLFLVSACFLTFHFTHKPTHLRDLCYAAAAAGLMLGTKSISLAHIALLLATVFLLVLWQRRGFRQALTACGVFFLIAFLLGGYWYYRNWRIYGNPFAPMPISILGQEIFPGMATAEQLMEHRFPFSLMIKGINEPITAYNFHTSSGGLGFIFLALLVPGAFTSLFLFGRLREKFVHVVIVSAVLLSFVLTPAKFLRFSLYLPGVFAVLSAVTWVHVKRRTSIVISSVLVFGALYSVFNCTPQGFLNPDVLWSAKRSPYPLAACDYLWGSRFKWIRENTSPGTRIAYAGISLVYPLFGPDFQNSLYYVPTLGEAHEKGASSFEQASGRVAEPHARRCLPARDEQSWIEQLDQLHIDFLILGNDPAYLLHPISSVREQAWADARTDRFKLIDESEGIRVYQVLSGPGGIQ